MEPLCAFLYWLYFDVGRFPSDPKDHIQIQFLSENMAMIAIIRIGFEMFVWTIWFLFAWRIVVLIHAILWSDTCVFCSPLNK